MGVRAIKLFVYLLLVLGLWVSGAWASYVTVEARSLTLPSYSMGTRVEIPRMDPTQGLTLMPFYFQLNFNSGQNLNWGIELYSDNRLRLTGTASASADGLYRGLRGYSNPNYKIPLYWQSYPVDQNVAATLGTPQSVTNVVGGLALYDSTLRYWGVVYDKGDVDRINTWDAERPDRIVANVNGVGKYPTPDRPMQGPYAFLYFGADLRHVTSQEYVGQLVMDFFHYPFDFNRGCYVTPNPVKPVLGQRAFFNFYTNYSDSRIKIKIYDPTGYPVATLDNVRYWDCRNSNGHLVEGGLYLYQIEVEGHFISGTMVVIK